MRSAATNPFLPPFSGRQAALNAAYVSKGALAYADNSSELSSVDERQMCATFTITSEDVDRVGDVVVTKGISLANFCRNPIGFFNHQGSHGQYLLPIGIWECDGECTIKIGRGKATGTIYFSRRSREAEQVFALVAEGVLRSTSIGFNPIDPPQPRADGGFRFPKVDLLEVSVVGIPCQPTATLVRETLSRNKLAGHTITSPIRKSLECLAEPAPAWANGATFMAKKKTPKAVSIDRLGGLLKLIPKEVQDELEECAAGELPKIRKDHPDWTQEQCQAMALSLCGEKALSGSSGAAGGFTIPPDDRTRVNGKTVKAPPPPKPKPKPQGQGPPPPQPQQGQPPPPPQPQQGQPPMQGQPPDMGAGRGDPKDVLNRLVDALTDYLDLTGGADAAPPGVSGADIDEGDGDEFGEFDPEADEQGEEITDPDEEDDDEDEEDRLRRYQQRTGIPGVTKRGRYYSVGTMKRCKEVAGGAADHLDEIAGLDDEKGWGKSHRTASKFHSGELRSLLKAIEDEPEVGADGDDLQPDEVKAITDVLHVDFDAAAILKELTPIKDRVTAVGSEWQRMNGRMPEQAVTG